MLNINLTIQYADERKDAEIKVGPSTQVAFEREHNVGIMAIATEQKLSHVYWLAWHASKPGVDFDAWLESIDSIDVDVSAPDPTKPAPPAAESLTSP